MLDLGGDPRALFAGLVREGRSADLSHAMTPGMPVYGPHAPYTISLHRRHGDPHPRPRAGLSSFANELLVTSAHAATHIDAIGHFSRDGLVHGGCPAAEIETAAGLSSLDAGELGAMWRRGVLLDVARQRGVATLAAAEPIGAEELAAVAEAQGTEVVSGDVVLVRTGWARYWGEPERFNNAGAGWPGPGDGAARWLIERGVHTVGSDTPAFEAIPSPGDSVHALLLVDNAIHIVENLALEELAALGVHEFLFVGLPLRIVGATGSPFRPMALW
ncbi:MAG: cyclase family protein [Acidimicrobiia bacterium]|nr:cyclase family protein [Acidimicrobiia bacterium]